MDNGDYYYIKRYQDTSSSAGISITMNTDTEVSMLPVIKQEIACSAGNRSIHITKLFVEIDVLYCALYDVQFFFKNLVYIDKDHAKKC